MEIKEEKYEMNIGKFPVYSWLCFLFLLFVITGCDRKKEQITIISPGGSIVNEYAVEEIIEILGADFDVCRSEVPLSKGGD